MGMVVDIANNPRVNQLLGQIEELRRAEEAGQERGMAELYVEIGQYVHWLIRQEPQAIARIEEEGRRWASEVDTRVAAAPRPVVKPRVPPPLPVVADDLEVDAVEVPSGDPVPAEVTADSARASFGRDGSDPSPAVEYLAEAAISPLELSADDLLELVDVEAEPLENIALEEAFLAEVEPIPDGEELTDSVALSAATPAEHEWVRGLRDLLGMLGSPETGALDQDACQQAANRLLNATTQMEVRWIGFPDSTQQALVGLIASRCRNLQDRMAVDVEVRMTLGRLRRFHSARGLPVLPALKDGARPEGPGWEADSRRWWTLLRRGT